MLNPYKAAFVLAAIAGPLHPAAIEARPPKASGRSAAASASRGAPFEPDRAAHRLERGQGILAPNGYRGEGSATGGPAGGIDSGGP